MRHETTAAARFVFVGRADFDARVRFDRALRIIRRLAALDADGVSFLVKKRKVWLKITVLFRGVLFNLPQRFLAVF